MYVLVHSRSTFSFIYQYNSVRSFLITQNEEMDGESRVCGGGEKICVLIKYKFRVSVVEIQLTRAINDNKVLARY